MNPPKGYWNVYQAVRWCDVARESAHEDLRKERDRTGDMAAALAALGRSPFIGAQMGAEASVVLREALECGELRAAALMEDGELATMRPADWRRPFFGRAPDYPQLCQPFLEAMEGGRVQIQIRTGQGPERYDYGTPLIACADLSRWSGMAEPFAEPPERPADWPKPTEPAANASPIERARLWLHGYVTALRDAGRAPRRDDGDMIRACQKATGCTVDAAREAYGALPMDLRNPNPEEKRMRRASAEK